VNVSNIILAGGASARMGRPKALLDFDGRSCLALVLSACLESVSSETILVLGVDEAPIRAALSGMRFNGSGVPASLRVVVNGHPERGQTSSLKTGLEGIAGDADGFLVLPIDYPLITGSDLDALILRFEGRQRRRSIFIAAHEGERGHPVLFAASHRGAILELGDDEPLNEYVRVREGETEVVPMPGDGVVLSMNTPEQYEHLLSVYRAREAASHA